MTVAETTAQANHIEALPGSACIVKCGGAEWFQFQAAGPSRKVKPDSGRAQSRDQLPCKIKAPTREPVARAILRKANTRASACLPAGFAERSLILTIIKSSAPAIRHSVMRSSDLCWWEGTNVAVEHSATNTGH